MTYAPWKTHTANAGTSFELYSPNDYPEITLIVRSPNHAASLLLAEQDIRELVNALLYSLANHFHA